MQFIKLGQTGLTVSRLYLGMGRSVSRPMNPSPFGSSTRLRLSPLSIAAATLGG